MTNTTSTAPARDTTGETVARRAKVGDYVRTIRDGHVYLVTEVKRSPAGRVELYGVESYTSGLPNAFGPAEVETLAVAYVKRELWA